jgi:hypothetical protein
MRHFSYEVTHFNDIHHTEKWLYRGTATNTPTPL